MNKPAYSRQNA